MVEREARTFELDNLDREILLPDTEDLEIAEDRLLRFGMAIDLDTQEVTLVLPVEFTLRNTRLAMGVVRGER